MFKNLYEFWADTIIDYRIFWVFVMFLALGVSALLLIKLPPKYDNSFEMFMLKDDPNIVIFENFRDLFGDAEYLSVGISARLIDQDLFVAETIKVIDEISSMLENHEFVTKVTSLSNYQYTRGENGIMTTDNLFEEPSLIKKNSSDLTLARDIISKESLAHDRFITKDLQHTRIIARTEYIRNENFHKVRLSNDIYDFLDKKDYFSKGYRIRLGGSAIIAERFEFLSKRDTSILNPVVASIMCLIIYNLFGSLFFCLLPWLLIGTSVLLVSGLQSWLGYPMTIVNTALIPTLMIIGMAVSVHVLSEFLSLRKDGNVPQSAAKKVIKNLLRPIFFTAFTTSLGFGALAVTALVPLKQYALLAGMGSIIIFFVAMTFFVSLLSFVKVIPDNNTELIFHNLIDRVTQALVKFTFINRKIIVLFAVAGVIFCVITLPKITVDSNIFNYFKSDSWINQDMEYFDELYKFGGIEVIVDSGEFDGIKNPKFLKMVDLMEKRLNGYEKTGKVYSTIELLKQLRQTLNANDEGFFILPDSSEMTAQLLLMYENSGPDEDLSDLIDFDNQYLRLTVPINNLSAKVILSGRPGSIADIVYPEIDRRGEIDLIRRQSRYMELVDEIWSSLKRYVE